MRYEIISRPKQINFPKIISLDTEYSNLDVKKAELLSISVGVSPDLTYIFENHKAVQPFLDAANMIFTWNGAVDAYMLEKSGYKINKSRIVDAMLMEHLVDERLNHGLGDFALREFDDNYKDEFWKLYDRYEDAPKEVAYEYEMRDGCYTFRAATKYLELLDGKQDLIKHAHRLYWALFDTEIKGLRVDTELMRSTKETMSAAINAKLVKLREGYDEYCKIWEMQKWVEEIEKRKTDAGRSKVPKPVFSFTSDKHVAWLVYEGLKCPITEKTKKGAPSTSFETLKGLSEAHPEISEIVEYKDIKAVYATFVEGMLERVENDRIYPRFNVNGTATGRISHANPNMGNLPTEGIIRNFFLPDADCVLVGADYSQLEVVVEANLTEDKQLLRIILEGASKHDITAQGLNIPRDVAKTLNFALQYGAGVRKISKILGISVKDSEDVFDRYWQLYSGVKTLKDKTAKILEDQGQVTNLFGRTRHFDKPKNEFEKARQERQAYNHLIQGVGADITNMATYLISEEFNYSGTGRVLFSVHDEIVTEVREDLTQRAIAAIVKLMGVPNVHLNFKYPVQCKLYGPLNKWAKT